MQSAISNIESLISKAGDLAETKIELLKLQATGKISETVSSLIASVTIVLLVAVALLILSIGAAFWIGYSLGNLSHGFFIVGGFYIVAGLFIYLFRNALIKRPLSNLLIDKMAR